MDPKSIPGGGPAFPRSGFSGPEGFGRPENGMTLRDYFAAHATEEDIRCSMVLGESWEDREDRAEARYRHADAMLAAR
jgi:hypothetical protein